METWDEKGQREEVVAYTGLSKLGICLIIHFWWCFHAEKTQDTKNELVRWIN